MNRNTKSKQQRQSQQRAQPSNSNTRKQGKETWGRMKDGFRDQLIKEEAKRYSHAVSVAKKFVHPHHKNASGVDPTFCTSAPMTANLPKAVAKFNFLPNGEKQTFAALAFPNAVMPIYITDPTKLTPFTFATPWIAERKFIPGGYPSSKLTPEGRRDNESRLIGDENGAGSYQQFYVSIDQKAIAFSHFLDEVAVPRWATRVDSVWLVPTLTDILFQYSARTISVEPNSNVQTLFIRYRVNGGPLQNASLPFDFSGSLTLDVNYNDFNVVTGDELTIYDFGLAWTDSYPTLFEMRTQVRWHDPPFQGGHSLFHGVESDLFQSMQAQAETYAVRGQALHIEWSGSTLNNGGRIAAHRLPRNVDHSTVTPEDRYSWISEIPDSYNGPLKKGTYGFWLPENIHNLDYKPITDIEFAGPTLICAGEIDDPSETVIAYCYMNIQFTTISRLYAPTYPGVDTEAIALVLTMLARTMAFGENDNHLTRINKIFSKIEPYIAKIKSGLHTAQTVAQLVAPIIAAI